MSARSSIKDLASKIAPTTTERAMDRYVLWRWKRDNRARVVARRAATPDASSRAINEEFRREGIVTTDFEIAFEGGSALAASATERAHSLWMGFRSGTSGISHTDAVEEGKEFKLHLLPPALRPDDPFLRMALDPRMLEIAGHHLGMVPYLRVIDLWWDRPTSEPPKETQLWHRDYDDVRIVKVFVYFNDVDAEAGPFSFIPRTHFGGSAAPIRAQVGKRRRTTDEDMEAIVPRSSWRVCTGPATSTVICDTTGYHKGQKPTAKDRLLLLLEYTSPRTHMSRSFTIDGEQSAFTPVQRAALEVGR